MFEILRTDGADATYRKLKARALESLTNRNKNKRSKTSRLEGLFKQVHKTFELLATILGTQD